MISIFLLYIFFKEVFNFFSFQDVVYALAHATGKTGRFTLIERWRNNERLLAPQEHPLKVLFIYILVSNKNVNIKFILKP
jgi:Ras association domain-containing protein 7/8